MNYLRLSVKCYGKSLLLLLIFFLFAVFNASAADVTVAWDANSESDLAGYTFFYGTSSGIYTFSEDVGNTTSYTAINLTAGTTYYFAAKAYDTSDNESGYSQELVYTIPVPNSAPDTPAQPTGPVIGYVQTTYSYDTSGTDPDGDLLTYRFDWGDASISGWGGAYSRTHAYTAVGDYCIKAQSQDTQGATSGWSACLNVNIDILQHTITASAGLNGSISPSGSVSVDNGADRTFTINPDPDYWVADVVVDGSSVGSPTTYTFDNVDRGHTIAASFETGNQPPVSNAGPDQTVQVNDTVQLDGSSSSDANGDSLTYAWSFTVRPNGSNANLSDTTALNPGFDIDVAGTYTVRLIVNDGTVDSASDTVTIFTENSAPVANAGADQTVQVNDTVRLDGSSSSDVDGDPLTFSWSFISVPAGSLNMAASASVDNQDAGFSTTGSWNESSASDEYQGSSYYTSEQGATATWTPDFPAAGTYNVYAWWSYWSDRDTNALYTINYAGGSDAIRVNQQQNSGQWILLGTYSFDAGTSGSVMVTRDSQSTAGSTSADAVMFESSATLSGMTEVNPSFVADAAGTYIVQLIVNDGMVNAQADTVVISTENSPPAASAGADQTMRVNDLVQLDGSASSDVDGDALTFVWSFVSKPGGSAATLSDATALRPTFVVDAAGAYTVRLIVNDGAVDSAPDTVTISTQNSAPVANAGADQAVLVNDTVQLNGSASSDVDGDTLSIRWSLVSKPGGSAATLSDTTAVRPTFVVDAAGTYTARLIVNDGALDSAPDTVTISTENSAPIANAGADQAVLINDTVQLNGSASSDVDGDALLIRWSLLSKPDGSTAALLDATAVRPTFVVDVAGTYVAQLIVNDGRVDSAPDTTSISTENSVPVANAGTDQAVRIDDTVQLDGDGSRDADGDTLTYKWSVISRPGGSNATLSSTIDRQPTFRVDAAGTYTMQLIVYDGTDYSAPDTVTLVTENAAPLSNAGSDLTVDEGDTVTLSGMASTDPDDNITGYSWQQTGGALVTLSNSNGAESTFVAPVPETDSETLTFELTVEDADGLLDVDMCSIVVNRISAVDSDADGVPDNQDAFPTDPDESLDTDGDGEGNNADTDDDNDGMPDSWELSYGLDPLKDDAAADPDGDDVSNINEYNLGSQPDHFEGNFLPETPEILTPENSATVSLTPLLETGEFNDPNINDVHHKTQWKIRRAFDDVCVFDVATPAALTSIVIPKQVLEEDTEYIWQARFIDNHKTPSPWSEERDFITDLAVHDVNKNGVPDDQEVLEEVDFDKDGNTDLDQSDMKCVSVEAGAAQICISIRDAENAVSIISLEVEDPNDPQLVSQGTGKPNFFEFGMLDFKLLVNHPGDETTVTIYLSKKAYTEGNCFKYDPVNGVWMDYSDYTRFSPNRKEVYLTLKDGGFGDADGIENGIIVDPLAFGSETDPSGDSSGSPIDEIVDGIIPTDLSCFISVAAGDSVTNRPGSAWQLARTLEFWLILMLPFLLYLFKTMVAWILTMEKRMKNRPEPGDFQARFPL